MGSTIRRANPTVRQRRPVAAAPSAQVCPEDVFLLWLLQLPEGTDVAEAARKEIARLDRAAPLSPGPARLRELMVAASESGLPPAC